MADDDFEVQHASSGAAEYFPIQCSALRKNGHVLIKNRACKIVDMSTSKTGKHGHAKVHLVALDVFTGKKYEDICPSTHNMNVPNIKRTEYQLLDIDGEGFVSLMTENGDMKEDLKLPEDPELKKKLQEAVNSEGEYMVTVLMAMGEEMIISMKSSSNKE